MYRTHCLYRQHLQIFWAKNNKLQDRDYIKVRVEIISVSFKVRVEMISVSLNVRVEMISVSLNVRVEMISVLALKLG